MLYTDLDSILELAAARLVEWGVVDGQEAALIVADDPQDSRLVPHFLGDKDVCLWAQDEVSDPGTASAGGQLDTRAISTFCAVPRSRLSLDQSGQSRQSLINGSRGHLRLRRAVRAALHLWWPTGTASGRGRDIDVHGVAPAHWVRTQRAVRDRLQPEWLSSVLVFQITYQVDLS